MKKRDGDVEEARHEMLFKEKDGEMAPDAVSGAEAEVPEQSQLETKASSELDKGCECLQGKAEGERRGDSCCCREGIKDDSAGKRSLEQTEEYSTVGHGAKYANGRNHITAESNVKEWEDTTEKKQPDVYVRPPHSPDYHQKWK